MVRLVKVLRPGVSTGRRLLDRESLERWKRLRYWKASLLGRCGSLGFHSPEDFEPGDSTVFGPGDSPCLSFASAGFHSVGSRSDLPS